MRPDPVMPGPDTALAESLIDLLDRMRASLRAGDHAALPDLADRIERVLPALPGEAALATAILQAARQTQDCLVAARAGLRAAQRRVAELRAGQQALGTYDRSGVRKPLASMAPAAKRL